MHARLKNKLCIGFLSQSVQHNRIAQQLRTSLAQSCGAENKKGVKGTLSLPFFKDRKKRQLEPVTTCDVLAPGSDRLTSSGEQSQLSCRRV